LPVIIVFSFFFNPIDTKPQAGKLGYTYKIMVATAIYSVTMTLWKETAFPLRRATKNVGKGPASLVSSVVEVMRL